MGCCQSIANDEPVWRPQGPAPAGDVCFPDKFGHGGVKVFASSAVAAGSSNRIFTRLVVGPNWMLAALFEAHTAHATDGSSNSTSHRPLSEAAAQYCAEHCYTEYIRASAGNAGGNGSGMRGVLAETLRALDKRFLKDTDVPQQDRLASGCSAALLQLDLGPADRVATAATLGPCAAVVGQRRGGLASATSFPLLLSGGASTSHQALQEFLSWLASEQPSIEALAAKHGGGAPGRNPSLRKRSSSKAGAPPEAAEQPGASQAAQQSATTLSARPQQEPRYSQEPSAAHAIGFGCAKGMGWAAGGVGAGSGAVTGGVLSPRRKPRLGMAPQTASHPLGPGDECVVLLSGGAVAAITPADVALLMHRMGHLSAIPYEVKAPPLPLEDSRLGVVQLDSLGGVGPRLMTQMAIPAAFVPPSAAATPRGGYGCPGANPAASKVPPVAPFNAARLLVQQAAATAVASRSSQQQRKAGGGSRGGGIPAAAPLAPPAGAMAFALEWPTSTGGDTVVAAAAAGASVSAIRATAAAAVRDRRRGLYLWQLLRLYYKIPYKRKVATINRWHELFDQLVAKACREARSKEVTAWKRLGAVLQVSNAGNVKSIATPPSTARGGNYPPGSPTTSARYRSPRTTPPAPGSAAAALAAVAAGHSQHGGGSRQPSPRATPTSARYRSPRPSPGRATTPPPLSQQLQPTPGSARNRSPAPMPSGRPPTSARKMSASRPPSARELANPTTPPLTQRGNSDITPRSAAQSAAAVAAAAAASSQSVPLVRPSPLIDVAPPPAPSHTAANVWQQDSGAQRSGGSSIGQTSGSAAAAGVPSRASSGLAGAGSGEVAVGLDASAAPRAGRVSLISNVPVSQIASGAAAVAAGYRPPATATASAIVPATSDPSAAAGANSGADKTVSPRTQPESSVSTAPRSLIPTLQLQPVLAAGAPPPQQHTTPRLSAPGGFQSGLPAPPTTAAPTRANNTCGGAINTTPVSPFAAAAGTGAGTPDAAAMVAAAAAGAAPPTSARGGTSRLPRPSGQSGIPSPAPSARSPLPVPGEAGLVPSPRRLASDAISSIARPPTQAAAAPAEMGSAAVAAPPPAVAAAGVARRIGGGVKISVGGANGSSAGGALAPSTGTSHGGGGEMDLLSPNADQLAAWAMEAVAIIASPRQEQDGKPAPGPAPPAAVTPQPGKEQQQELGRSGAGVKTGGAIASAAAAAVAAAATGACGNGERPLSARPTLGSRIPLSPRDDNNNPSSPSPRTANTTPWSLVPGGKSSSALLGASGPGAAGLGRTTSGGGGELTPLGLRSTASLRARR